MVFKRGKKMSQKPKTGQACCKEDISTLIQKRAYQLYEQRGYSHGNDWSDWFEAERLVKKEQARK